MSMAVVGSRAPTGERWRRSTRPELVARSGRGPEPIGRQIGDHSGSGRGPAERGVLARHSRETRAGEMALPAGSARACLCWQLRCEDGGDRRRPRMARGGVPDHPGVAGPRHDPRLGRQMGVAERAPWWRDRGPTPEQSHVAPGRGARSTLPAGPGPAIVLPAGSARACLCWQLRREDGGNRHLDRGWRAEGRRPTRASPDLDTTQGWVARWGVAERASWWRDPGPTPGAVARRAGPRRSFDTP
jgi:hypothetical protein